jgi:hypothetical protein
VRIANSLATVKGKGSLRAGLTTTAGGSPSLSLCDQADKSWAGMALLPDGTPHLVLTDYDGRIRAGVGGTAHVPPQPLLSD